MEQKAKKTHQLKGHRAAQNFSNLRVLRRGQWKAKTCKGRGVLVNSPGFRRSSLEAKQVEPGKPTNTLTRLKSSGALIGYR